MSLCSNEVCVRAWIEGKRVSSKEQLIFLPGFVLWQMHLQLLSSRELVLSLRFPQSFHCQQGYDAHSEEFGEKRRRNSRDHKRELHNAYQQVESAFQM